MPGRISLASRIMRARFAAVSEGVRPSSGRTSLVPSMITSASTGSASLKMPANAAPPRRSAGKTGCSKAELRPFAPFSRISASGMREPATAGNLSDAAILPPSGRYPQTFESP